MASSNPLKRPMRDDGTQFTFVFFDTEATGLPTEGDLPKFTELSFLAVSGKDLQQRDKTLRVLQKLTLCFNPGKRLTQSAINISGLSNDLLHDCPTFAEQATMIVQFLKQLPGSVRLVAHSGNKFDFPLLVRHLEDADVDVEDLTDVKCTDTFEVFKKCRPMGSYKLSNIYRSVCHQSPPVTHSAETDSKMLMDIVHKIDSPSFFSSLCQTCKPLSFFKCPPQDFCKRFRNYV